MKLNLEEAIKLLKTGKSKNEVAKILGYNSANTFVKALARSNNEKNTNAKMVEQVKLNSPALPPQTISLYRHQWENAMAEAESKGKGGAIKAWITIEFEEKSGVNFSKEKKEREAAEKKALKADNKKKKKAEEKQLKKTKFHFRVINYKPITQQNRELKAEVKKLKAKLEKQTA